jgi:hypothetical protein
MNRTEHEESEIPDIHTASGINDFGSDGLLVKQHMVLPPELESESEQSEETKKEINKS